MIVLLEEYSLLFKETSHFHLLPLSYSLFILFFIALLWALNASSWKKIH